MLVQKPKQSKQIVLASTSPRRKELLERLGIHFEVFAPDVAEILEKDEKPLDYVKRLAAAKAQAIWNKQQFDKTKHNDIVVIAADTIVVLDQTILEKPADHADARRMLAMISGKNHTVYTGVCLLGASSANSINRAERPVAAPLQHVFTVATQVYIKQLSDAEIKAYVATDEPMDKAGSYAAQGIGSYLIQKIEGSYTNVIGLPLCELMTNLREQFDFTWSL